MVHYRGQIVDTSKSGGLTIGQKWVQLLDANEQAFEDGKPERVLDDQDLTAAMFLAFPGRRSSAIFRDVVKVRNRYNRGVIHCQKGVRPARPSYRYVRLGGGGVRRITARGRQLAELGT